MNRIVPSSLYGDYVAQLHALTAVRPSGCWEFIGYVAPNGYGQLGRNTPAHRVAWESARGPIPEGFHVDHLCRNTICVNPDHLEPVTQRENLRRGIGFAGLNAAKTHCDAGHEFTEDNIYYRPDRLGRLCRECRRAVSARRRGMQRNTYSVDTKIVRRWAQMSGLVVADRSRLSRAVIAAWNESHPDRPYFRIPSDSQAAA